MIKELDSGLSDVEMLDFYCNKCKITSVLTTIAFERDWRNENNQGNIFENDKL